MLVTVLPQNDDYLIFATTSNTNPDGIGSYTLKFTTNVITQINYGTNLTNAAITTSDIQISTGDYWDVYWFQGTQGDRVQIDLTSTAFNAYLVLNKVSGDFVSDDDNSAGGTNARISPTSSPRPLASLPETGKYIIIATPYAPNVTGSYTLSLTRLTSAPAEAAESQTEQPVFLVMPGRDGLAEFYRQNGSNSERFARRRVINR
jgi:serine protease Do